MSYMFIKILDFASLPQGHQPKHEERDAFELIDWFHGQATRLYPTMSKVKGDIKFEGN